MMPSWGPPTENSADRKGGIAGAMVHFLHIRRPIRRVTAAPQSLAGAVRVSALAALAAHFAAVSATGLVGNCTV
jgi:hypothetical protein